MNLRTTNTRRRRAELTAARIAGTAIHWRRLEAATTMARVVKLRSSGYVKRLVRRAKAMRRQTGKDPWP